MSFTTFKGQANLSDSSPIEIVSTNLKAWMDWAFLAMGGYTNITIPSSGHYGGDFSTLRRVVDPNFSAGQVWEGVRKDWVWETGVPRAAQPIRVSGVQINGTFNFFSALYPNAVNKIEGYVDYPNGRIILGSGIATNATVKASYSYRWVHVYEANSDDVLKIVQYNSMRPDHANFRNAASGDWSEHPEMRVQLPAIVIEKAGSSDKPYELGGGHYAYSDFVCHVLSENDAIGSRLGFILKEQQEKTIGAFNSNRVAAVSGFPLDLNGSVQSGALNYPQLVDTYPFANITIVETNMQSNNKIGQNLSQVPVRLRTETILAENY